VLEGVVDRPRVDRVDADPAVGDLLGRGAHEPDERVLRRRVGGDAGVGGEADDARVEDQAAARAHRAQGVLGDVERAEHVDREHAREDLLVVVGHRRDVAEDPGVGERDVEFARLRHRGRHRRGDRGHRGLRAQLVGEGVQGVSVDVRQRQASALGGEPARGRRADAAGGAGDERRLVLESAHGNLQTIKLDAI